MKKDFLRPELLVSKFSVEDIITASGATAQQLLEEKMDTVKNVVVDWNTIQE